MWPSPSRVSQSGVCRGPAQSVPPRPRPSRASPSRFGSEPLKAWDNLPADGKWQIVGIIGAIESIAEAQKPHYMRGGTPGKIWFLWDPAGLTDSLSAEELKTKRLAELNNGRLAMIGILGFTAASIVPGSVPGLTGVVEATYKGGLPFAPF